jgi:Ethanolamine utilization protein EutJ (predicted chaperonin)
MIENIKRVFIKRRVVPNLLILEIVEKLYNKLEGEQHYGITELYEVLLPPKATFSNFRIQISTLEAAGCILVTVSSEKASKKSVYLAEQFREELSRDVYVYQTT